MRARKIAAIIVAALSLILPSCTSNEPALPDASDPYQIRDRVASAAGQQFLKDVTTFKWKDHGAQVARLFTWVPEWSTALMQTKRQAAAETAYAIASFLADAAPNLLDFDNADNRHLTVEDVNPAIIESYANSVIPFLGAMVGDQGNTIGFPPLDPQGSSMPRTFAMLTVPASVDASSADIGMAIVKLSDHYRDLLSTALGTNPPSSQTVNAQVLRLAQLFGLAFSSGLKAPDSSPYIFNPEVAQTELDYTLARATISGPNEDIDRAYFGAGGKLLPPEYVRQHSGEAAWGEYSGMLGRYVARSNSLIELGNQFSELLNKVVSSNHRH